MTNYLKRNAPYFIISAFLIASLFILANNTFAQNELEDRLSGRILLQVEEHGEAWYVNPQSRERRFLGRPDDAFKVMREEGLGISNANLDKIPVGLDHNIKEDSDGDGLSDAFENAIGTDPNKADTDGDGFDDKTELENNYSPNGKNRLGIDKNFAQGQKGKIFLAVERNGEAWYVDPEDNKRYFLGRPDDAFQLMRRRGLGVSNQNLNQIRERAQNKNQNGQSENENQNEVISYMNNDFGFELFFPKTWEGYLVETKSSVFEKYEKSYNTKEVNFKLNALDECNDEYCNIFTITVFDKSDFEQLLKDNKEDVEVNGFNVFTDIGKSIGSNIHYTFVIPTNIFGQAYPGPNIYEHQQEAVAFLKNIKTFNVKEDLINNHNVEDNVEDDYKYNNETADLNSETLERITDSGFSQSVLNCEEDEYFSYNHKQKLPQEAPFFDGFYNSENEVTILKKLNNNKCQIKYTTWGYYEKNKEIDDEVVIDLIKSQFFSDKFTEEHINFALSATLSNLEEDERFNYLFAEDDGASIIDKNAEYYDPNITFMEYSRKEMNTLIDLWKDGFNYSEEDKFINICSGETGDLLKYLKDQINGKIDSSCTTTDSETKCVYNGNVTCIQERGKSLINML